MTLLTIVAVIVFIALYARLRYWRMKALAFEGRFKQACRALENAYPKFGEEQERVAKQATVLSALPVPPSS